MDEAPRDIVDRQPPTVVEVEKDECARCDIPVPAKVYAKLPSGRCIAYCGHHGTEYMAGLLEAGATIIDQRWHDDP